MRFALLALSLSAVFALRGEPSTSRYGGHGDAVNGEGWSEFINPISEADQDKFNEAERDRFSEADQEKFIKKKSPWKSFKRLFKRRRGKANISGDASSKESNDQIGSGRITMRGFGDSVDDDSDESYS